MMADMEESKEKILEKSEKNTLRILSSKKFQIKKPIVKMEN